MRASRPVFKVEQYGLSEALVQVAGTGGLDFRTFATEQEAIDWLLA